MTEPIIGVERCQRCGRMYELDNSHRPEPPEGDVVICMACGFCEIFTGHGWDARLTTPAERAELLGNEEVLRITRQISEARAAALIRGREERRRKSRWN